MAAPNYLRLYGSDAAQGAPPLAPPRAAPTRTVPVPINYRALLGGDLALQQTLGGINASSAAAKTALANQRNAALIGFGEAPGADALTQQLAGENTTAGLSTLARLQHAYDQQRSASIGSLAGRGILHSGAYLQHAQEDLLANQQQQQDARQQLLNTLAQNQQTYAQGQQELAGQAASATSDALNRIVSQVNAGVLTPGVRTVPAVKRPTAAAPLRMPSLVRRNSY